MKRQGRWCLYGLVLGLSAFLQTGCLVNMMALPFFLFAGESLTDPAVKLVKGKRDHKKVVVIPYADASMRFGFDALDTDLAGLVVTEIANGDDRLEVVPERKVRAWRDQNPQWIESSLQKVGEHFDADYVIFFEVQKFTLNETKNQFLLQATCDITVRVHDVAKDTQIFDQVYHREYPPGRAVPLSEVVTEEQFRTKFLRTVARELSWYVVPHKFAEEINDL